MGESELKKNKKTSSSSSSSLPPGFRFHPTDEELVWYYLRRKVAGKPLRLDAISEIDIYKVEPSDLPGLSKLKSRDREWYFFSGLDRKYGNGMRTNRATLDGYWKTTGKDRPVHHGGRTVGMKKTLVYHFGRAPRGKRTDWVMHEYKLADNRLEKSSIYPLDGYVLCRIFRKSGAGPKNGEHPGAPLVDAELSQSDDDEPCILLNADDPCLDDDAFIEHNDLLQELAPLPDSCDHQGSQSSVDEVAGTCQMPTGKDHEYENGPQDCTEQEIFDLLAQVGSSTDVVKNEYMPQQLYDECNKADFNLPAEPNTNVVSDGPIDYGFFDASDFLDPPLTNTLDSGCFGPYLGEELDIDSFLNFDIHPELTGDQAYTTIDQNAEDALWQLPFPSGQLSGSTGDSVASSSKQASIVKRARTGMSQAHRWLENIPAHPAYASELPTKDVASRLSAAVQSSSIDVTAGMIRIRREMPAGLQWSFDKTGNMNVLLSFDLLQTVVDPAATSSNMFPAKLAAAAVSRGWLCFMFFWMMLFAVSIKIGICIYAK